MVDEKGQTSRGLTPKRQQNKGDLGAQGRYGANGEWEGGGGGRSGQGSYSSSYSSQVSRGSRPNVNNAPKSNQRNASSSSLPANSTAKLKMPKFRKKRSKRRVSFRKDASSPRHTHSHTRTNSNESSSTSAIVSQWPESISDLAPGTRTDATSDATSDTTSNTSPQNILQTVQADPATVGEAQKWIEKQRTEKRSTPKPAEEDASVVVTPEPQYSQKPALPLLDDLLPQMEEYIMELKSDWTHFNLLSPQSALDSAPDGWVERYTDRMEVMILPWCDRFARYFIGETHVVTYTLKPGHDTDQKLIFTTPDLPDESRRAQMERYISSMMDEEMRRQVKVEFHIGGLNFAAGLDSCYTKRTIKPIVATEGYKTRWSTLGARIFHRSSPNSRAKPTYITTRHGMYEHPKNENGTAISQPLPTSTIVRYWYIDDESEVGETLQWHSEDPYTKPRESSNPIFTKYKGIGRSLQTRSDWSSVSDKGGDDATDFKATEVLCRHPSSHCNHVRKLGRLELGMEFQYRGAENDMVEGRVAGLAQFQSKNAPGVTMRAFQLEPHTQLSTVRGDSGADIIGTNNDGRRVLAGMVIAQFVDQTSGTCVPYASDMTDSMEELLELTNKSLAADQKMMLEDAIDLGGCLCPSTFTSCDCIWPQPIHISETDATSLITNAELRRTDEENGLSGNTDIASSSSQLQLAPGSKFSSRFHPASPAPMQWSSSMETTLSFTEQESVVSSPRSSVYDSTTLTAEGQEDERIGILLLESTDDLHNQLAKLYPSSQLTEPKAATNVDGSING